MSYWCISSVTNVWCWKLWHGHNSFEIKYWKELGRRKCIESWKYEFGDQDKKQHFANVQIDKNRFLIFFILFYIMPVNMKILYFGLSCFRREPLNEVHDSTSGILENYHCWRFHGSGVIAALQILGLIFFGTGMHHEYFLRSSKCFGVPHLCSKKTNIYNWSMDSGVHSVCFRGDFAIKTVIGFLR